MIHSGTIYKKGQYNKSWKERHFVLYNNRRLAYFAKESDTEPIKQIDLSDVQSINVIPTNANKSNNYEDDSKLTRMETISTSVKNSVDREFSFSLITPKRTYLLSVDNMKQFNLWIDHLEKAIFGGRLHQGWIVKRGAYRKSWKRRWFVIYDTQEMRYYDDQSRLQPRGLIKLHEVLLMCPGDKDQYSQPYTIQLMTPDRNWVLATASQKERDEWFTTLEETIHGAKRLITSHEGYLWKRGHVIKSFKRRYFALSKGWLFYFEGSFHCNKFKSIAFFSEAFFNQAFRLYVKGSIPLHQTNITKINDINNITTKDFNINKEFNFFKIVTDKREFQFATENENDVEKWFNAFHSTHSTNNHDGDDDSDDDGNDGSGGDNDNHEVKKKKKQEEEDILQALNINKVNLYSDNDNDDEEKNDNNKNRRDSKTPLMDIIDPKGNGIWVDLENANIEKQQSDALKQKGDVPK